uniref:Protein kinase domain-containing protein n=1 Tax=Romanomermis culicivorax TaxID=13658 RepID=A0A915I5D8_ROMCU
MLPNEREIFVPLGSVGDYRRSFSTRLQLFFPTEIFTLQICRQIFNYSLIVVFLLLVIGAVYTKAYSMPTSMSVSEVQNKRLRLLIKTIFEKRWLIQRVLGEGAYGSVYEVEDMTRKGRMFALKVIESNEPDVSESVKLLPLEVNVLRALRNIKAKHYPGYEFCGQTSRFNYVVMGLVGKNVNNLRKNLPDGKFSPASALHIGATSLNSLKEIHTAGYLHSPIPTIRQNRDVKPANMCIGRAPNDLRSVYMLDYGMCRKYKNEKGEFYTPRNRTGFRGTPWYASDNAMIKEELTTCGRGKFCSLCFTSSALARNFRFLCLIEFYAGKLPWQDDEDPPDDSGDYMDWLTDKKTPMITNNKILLKNCPNEFIQIFNSLTKTKFHEKPDYGCCNESLDCLRRQMKIDPDEVILDWEPKSVLSVRVAKLPDADVPDKVPDKRAKVVGGGAPWRPFGNWLGGYFSGGRGQARGRGVKAVH